MKALEGNGMAGSARAGGHASYLALDRLLLGVQEPGVAAHVHACAHCTAHLDAARARREGLAHEALPSWVVGLANATPPASVQPVPAGGRRAARSLPWGSGWRSAALGVLGAAALASAWLLFNAAPERARQGERVPSNELAVPGEADGLAITGHPNEADSSGGRGYVAAKGSPTVGVYVNRNGRVFLWNGVDAVRAGDRIRLGVASGGYRYVAVSSRHPTGLVTLYRGEVTPNPELPVAWAVDAEGDSERLVVVLSQRPLTDAELAQRERDQKLAAEVWAHEVVLPKTAGAQP